MSNYAGYCAGNPRSDMLWRGVAFQKVISQPTETMSNAFSLNVSIIRDLRKRQWTSWSATLCHSTGLVDGVFSKWTTLLNLRWMLEDQKSMPPRVVDQTNFREVKQMTLSYTIWMIFEKLSLFTFKHSDKVDVVFNKGIMDDWDLNK